MKIGEAERYVKREMTIDGEEDEVDEGEGEREG